MRRKAINATSITGSAGDVAKSPTARYMRATLLAINPANIMLARDAPPNRSLRKPARSTETPPKSGKTALFEAAAAALRPTTCVKYVGVHRLKVSRTRVKPKESRHANRNFPL